MRNRSFARVAGVEQPRLAEDNPRRVVQRFAAMYPDLLDEATLDAIAREAASYPRTTGYRRSRYRPNVTPSKLKPNDLRVCAALLSARADIGGRQLAPIFGRAAIWCEQAIAAGLVLMADRPANAEVEVEVEYDFAQREAQADAGAGHSH